MSDTVTRWHPLPPQWRQTAARRVNSVLLETARFDEKNHRSLLFSEPLSVLSANGLADLPKLFNDIEQALADGLYVAGYLNYECGYHFQSLEEFSPKNSTQPLAWFGMYRSPLIFDHKTGDIHGDTALLSASDAEGSVHSSLENCSFSLAEDAYIEKIQTIKEYIAAGDTYQVNFTDAVRGRASREGSGLYASRIQYQPVSYGAFLNTAFCRILSFSPELFFRIDDGRIVTRPMKGTMPRGFDVREDAEIAASLQRDEKNRAEHVMIVDLLRNDLGRICKTGSISVDGIFSIEKYRTLFQMTSTVSGKLLPDRSYYKIFKSLFPSGSVTGAPKIRTMQIIRELELSPRDVYTGAIGYIAPDRSSIFSVAIRTAILQDEQITMGVGSGIVADSQPRDEYQECQLKANFLTRTNPEFELIETLLWSDGFTLLPYHLDRLESSAAYFDFHFNRDYIQNELLAAARSFSGGSFRVRLLLGASGHPNVASTRFENQHKDIRVCLSQVRTFSGDVFLRHKTTCRDLYDSQYQKALQEGFDEVLFLNERDEVTEGAISNIFILRDGRLLTPPLHSGALPGVFRRHLLENDPRVQECVLTLHDLRHAEAIFLANSIRGLRKIASLLL